MREETSELVVAKSDLMAAKVVTKLPGSLAIISNQAFSLINFRGALIQELVRIGVRVLALAPDFTDDFRLAVRELGAEPVDYSLQRAGMNPIRDCWDTFKLTLLLRRLQPEATLSYFIKPVIFGTLAAWCAGIRRRYALIEGLGFVFMGDRSARQFKRRVLRRVVGSLYRLALANASRIILLNRDDINDLCAAGILQRSKAVLIPGIGVNLEGFPVSPYISNPISFILVARMLREKGIYEFVDAARIVRRTYPRVRCILVGGTDINPGAISEKELAAWQAEGIVEWTGHVSDVNKRLAAASVFVLPSYREGLPRSTQEAMSMSKPVITTDVPGCRDTVVDGENGFLVPARDPQALAIAMGKFVENPFLIETMGHASRRFAEKHFDQTIVIKKFVEVLSVE